MRILLATDGSEYSEAAAAYLVRLGFGDDAEVHVLHVLKDYLVPDELERARDFRKAGKLGAVRLVEEFTRKSLPRAWKARTLIREGEPWQEIVEAARELDAGLVVLGHRGATGLKRFLMGGVAHKVVKHSTVSTLIVRELPPSGRPMRVLYCTDGSFQARHALGLIKEMPFGSDTRLHLISVVDMEASSLPEKYYPDEEFSLMMAELRKHNQALAQKALDEDAEALGARFESVEKHLVFGVPEHEVLRAADELEADLVVMGCKGLSGIKGALLGSSSQQVVKHAGCGVLIAKSKTC